MLFFSCKNGSRNILFLWVGHDSTPDCRAALVIQWPTILPPKVAVDHVQMRQGYEPPFFVSLCLKYFSCPFTTLQIATLHHETLSSISPTPNITPIDILTTSSYSPDNEELLPYNTNFTPKLFPPIQIPSISIPLYKISYTLPILIIFEVSIIPIGLEHQSAQSILLSIQSILFYFILLLLY